MIYQSGEILIISKALLILTIHSQINLLELMDSLMRLWMVHVIKGPMLNAKKWLVIKISWLWELSFIVTRQALMFIRGQDWNHCHLHSQFLINNAGTGQRHGMFLERIRDALKKCVAMLAASSVCCQTIWALSTVLMVTTIMTGRSLMH